MPPVKKFDRESIIRASLELIRKEGKNNFNARRLASYLGCSVVPIFHNFTNMEELEQEVYKSVYNIYANMMINALKENSYKKVGLTYIKFAREYKEFFKMIFMQRTDLDFDNFMASGGSIEELIESGRKLTGLSFDKQKEFHKRVWIFTHGIACLINTGTVVMMDEEVESLLTDTVLDMLIGFRKDNCNE